MNTATVKDFLTILTGKLTQYDKRLYEKEQAKGHVPNQYRLSLLLQAKQEVEEKVSKYLDSDTPEAMEALKKALHEHFHVESMSPTSGLIKQIDAWVNEKQLPRYASLSDKVDALERKMANEESWRQLGREASNGITWIRKINQEIDAHRAEGGTHGSHALELLDIQEEADQLQPLLEKVDRLCVAIEKKLS